MAMPEHYRDTGRTNGLAITSLVTAIIGCTAWLGLIFGIIALVQIKNRGDRGRGMAIGGIVVACLWLVGGLVSYFVLPGVAKSAAAGVPTSVSSPTKTTPHDIEIQDIEPGQCFNDPNGGDGTVRITIVGCHTPHHAQALATFEFKDGPWPGEKVVRNTARIECTKRVGRKVDHDPAHKHLDVSWYTPTQEGWDQADADRSVLCTVRSATEGKKLTRPLR